MAHYAQNNQSIGPISLAKSIARFIEVTTMFYAFCTLFYWLMYTSQIPGTESFFWLFKPTWDFVGLFYTYKPSISNQLIDFTGVISTICLVILSNSVKGVHDLLNNFEATYKVSNAKRAGKTKAASKTVAAKKSYKDLTNFIFILDVKITNISNFIQEEKLSPEAMDNLKDKFHEALLNNLNQNQISQKGFYKKKLYLIYKDFDYIDNFIFYTRETLNSLSREFSKPTLRIDFLVGLSTLKHTDDLNQEINVLDTIICLSLKNEFITTTSFKNLYDQRTKKQYKPVTKGVYNLSKNLNISNNQEIYSLREST